MAASHAANQYRTNIYFTYQPCEYAPIIIKRGGSFIMKADKILTALLLTFLFSCPALAAETKFGEPLEVSLNVASITMNDNGMSITYEGIAGKYGMVHATHNMVATNAAHTKGYFTGTVQAIDDAGHLEQSMTLGLWSRSGTSLKVYGFDDDDLARILHISTVDLGTKVFNAEVWELD